MTKVISTSSRRLRQYYISSETLSLLISDGLALRKKNMMGDWGPIREMRTFRRMTVKNWSNQIPADAVIVGVHHDCRRAAICVTFQSEEFPIVPDGEMIPMEDEYGIEGEWEVVVVKTNEELVEEGTKFKRKATELQNEVDRLKKLIMGYEQELANVKTAVEEPLSEEETQTLHEVRCEVVGDGTEFVALEDSKPVE